VHHRAGGDDRERQAVARLDVRAAARDHGVALLQAVWREDVRLHAVCVVKQRDAGGAVGIIFDLSHLGRHADLGALEVDDTVGLLVTTATEARRDAPVVVAAAGARLRLQEALLRNVGGDLFEIADRVEAASG
jgi:hypothetical protein